MGYLRILYLLYVIKAWEVACITITGTHGQHRPLAPARNYRRHTATPKPVNWETGLKEAAYQALLREHYSFPDLKEHLASAPIVGKHDAATPFGDIAILARGQLYVTQNGYQFVQDNDDCKNCHSGHRCHRYECQLYQPQKYERILALWSIKRIRHRDSFQGHRYETEFTISPMISPASQILVTSNGGFNYDIPGHVFIVKSDTGNSFSYQNGNYLKGTDKWHQNPANNFGTDQVNQHTKDDNYKANVYSNVNHEGYNKHALHNIPLYLPPTSPIYQQTPHTITDTKEIELYRVLLDSLAAKTTSGSQKSHGTTKNLHTKEISSPTVPVIVAHPVYIPDTTPYKESVPQTTLHLTPATEFSPGKQQPSFVYSTQPQNIFTRPLHSKTQSTRLDQSTKGSSRFIGPQSTIHATQAATPSKETKITATSISEPIKPLESPITTIHYYMPVTEEEPHQTGQRTSTQKIHVNNKSTTTKKPIYSKKTYSTTRKTKYTKPTEDEYSDEEFDLFPANGPTEPMKPITQMPLTRVPVVPTKDQIQPPTHSTRTTVPYDSRRVTQHPVVQTRVTENQTQRTRPSTFRGFQKTTSHETKPSVTAASTKIITRTHPGTTTEITTEYAVKPTTQPGKVQPTTIFEYSFETTPRITTSHIKPILNENDLFGNGSPREPSTIGQAAKSSRSGRIESERTLPGTITSQYFYTPTYTTEIPTTRKTPISGKQGVRTTEHRYQTTTLGEIYTTPQQQTKQSEEVPITQRPHKTHPVKTKFPTTYETYEQPRTTIYRQFSTTYPQQYTETQQYQTTHQYTTKDKATETPPANNQQTTLFQENTRVTPPQTTFMQPVTVYQLSTEQQPTTNQPVNTLFIPTTLYPHPMTIFAYPTTMFTQAHTHTATYPTEQTNTAPVIISLQPSDLAFTTLAIPNLSTRPIIQTTQPTYAINQPKPAPVPSDDFLADKDAKRNFSLNLQHPNDYNEDDIFGTTHQTTRYTQTPLTYFTQSDLEQALFGTRKTEEKTTLDSAKVTTVVAPKVIFSNFYQASTLPATTPTPYYISAPHQTLAMTLVPQGTYETVTTKDNYNFLPLTQQSYSTSISFEVNKKNRTDAVTEPMTRLEFEPTIKAELKELVHPNGKFTIYKAELPSTLQDLQTTVASKTEDPKKKFDMLALQLVNHARSINYLNDSNKTTTSTSNEPKYKRRSYMFKSRRGQKRYNG